MISLRISIRIRSITELLQLVMVPQKSFNSRTFANLIVKKYIRNPSVNCQWIDEIAKKYNKVYENGNLSWSKQAAFERGSFATLLGIRYSVARDIVEITSIGDSLIVLLNGSQYVKAFPYAKSQDFFQHPVLLSTKTEKNSFLNNTFFYKEHRTRWNLSEYSNPILLIMTDALGQWALNNHEIETPKWIELTNIEDMTSLIQLVSREWKNKNLRNDDITLIQVNFK